MFDDPTFDGASYMDVGGALLAAARERPTLGLALARERDADADADAETRAWFVGTRLTDPAKPSAADVRFAGGAPPLAALARRVRRGEFGSWFEEVKEGVDSGRLQPMGGARGEDAPTGIVLSANPVIERVTFAPAREGEMARLRERR